MDGLSMIRSACAVGLSVRADGGNLLIKGLKQEGVVAARLIENKPVVLSALAEADCAGLPLTWPEEAVAHFLERLGVADELGQSAAPGAAAWGIAVAEANRVAARVPIPAGGLQAPRLVDHALSAFAPLGGLKLHRIVKREQLDPPLPNPKPKQCWSRTSLARMSRP